MNQVTKGGRTKRILDIRRKLLELTSIDRNTLRSEQPLVWQYCGGDN